MAPSIIHDDYEDSTISFGEYIFRRIKSLGIDNIFGVPGDFNLSFLENIYRVDGLNWIGCCNELNAAYAADGYGRAAGKPGVLITTFGVGELSAINGIAGAFAERSPILHIVGVSPKNIQGTQKKIHHLIPGKKFNFPDHKVYAKMIEPISCASAWLDDPKTAIPEFHRVIEQVYLNSQPGYIFLPTSSVDFPISSNMLYLPLDLGLPQLSHTDEFIARRIIECIKSSTNPVNLVDVLGSRNNGRPIITEFLEATQFNSFTTHAGISIINQSRPYYCGSYMGRLSIPGVKNFIESSDLVIHIGALDSDLNTGQFSTNIPEENKIALTPDYISIKGEVFCVEHFLHILKRITKELLLNGDYVKKNLTRPVFPEARYTESKSGLAQSDLLLEFQKILKPNDAIITETCSFQFAMGDMKLKENNEVVSQPYFASIGYALPSTLGVSIARRENHKPGRVFLFEGDGSSQMTIQELGTMIRNGVTPTIFLLNNDGYSVERVIMGENSSYNDICPNWKWTELLNVFGGDDKVFSSKVSNKEELENLFANEQFLKGDRLQFIELVMDRLDVPWRFVDMIQGK